MFSVNGIPLNDESRGWGVLTTSDPLGALSAEADALRVVGRDGVIPLELDTGPRFGRLVVETPEAQLETLLALVRARGTVLTSTRTPGRGVAFECLEAIPHAIDPDMTRYEVDFTLRYPSPFARSTAESTSAAAALAAASVNADVMPGISAPVGDAIVRVKGSATGLRVTDAASGAWFEYAPNVPAGSYLRFHSDTGRAFVTTSDTWTGGTEVSGDVDFNGPRGRFEITPYFTDPATRVGRLTVTTTARSGATVQVHGKAAYLV